MKLNSYIAVLLFSAALLPAADVQTAVLRHSLNTSVTNRDILVLAKSGYDEEFIIRVILGARCSCDVTADALAELAGQGITQRIIEVMLDASYRAGTPVAPVAMPDPGIGRAVTMSPISAPFASEMVAPGRVVAVPSQDGRVVTHLESVKTSAVATAVSGRVPMFEAMSALWGIWRKKSAVGHIDPKVQATSAVPGMLVNGTWQYLTAPAAPVFSPVGLGRQWHTAPPVAVMYSPAVPPVYTYYLVGR